MSVHNILKNDPGAFVLLTHKGKFSILERSDGMWDFAGGHVELGETPEQGAIRELFEETAIIAKPDDLTLIVSEIIAGYHSTLYSMELTETQVKSIKLDTNGANEHKQLVWIETIDDAPGELFPSAETFRRMGAIESSLRLMNPKTPITNALGMVKKVHLPGGNTVEGILSLEASNTVMVKESRGLISPDENYYAFDFTELEDKESILISQTKSKFMQIAMSNVPNKRAKKVMPILFRFNNIVTKANLVNMTKFFKSDTEISISTISKEHYLFVLEV